MRERRTYEGAIAVTDASLNWSDVDRKAVDTVRVLAMDAVEKAGNGHPGTAMSLAPAAYLLFQKVMRHDPTDPLWPGRDRFVLSCGHSSLSLYIQLYLAGYGLELSDLQQLRQWGSLTPGHPEHGHTAGVETTTGPLGQGVGNAVGFAMAARRERGLFDPEPGPGESLFDHNVYVLASDGDMEEGVSHEVAALAAHQKLGNLLLIWDDNQISIEDDTNIAKSEDVPARFEAYGWHVQHVDWRTSNGYHEDPEALYRAILAANAVTDKPSFIALRTIIGWPAPNKQNTGKIHGSALGADEVAATKKVLGFDPDQNFAVAGEVLEHTRKVDRARPRVARRVAAALRHLGSDPRGRAGTVRPDGQAGIAGRLDRGAAGLRPGRQGHRDPQGLRRDPAGDWTDSPGTLGWLGRPGREQQHHDEGEPSFIPPEHQTKAFPGGWYGRTMHFGIREHGMGSILNGIALHGGTRPYGGTFLVFSDYMRPAVRLAALMELPVIYVWTHDSIGLGEDGPTHQPIEHVTALRAIPGLDVVRPADANETAWAWRLALEHTDRPTALCLTRQNLPILDRTEVSSAAGVAKGGYVLADATGGKPEVILIATGSEVSLALERTSTAGGGRARRPGSCRCRAGSGSTPRTRRTAAACCRTASSARVSVEAGIAMGWRDLVGDVRRVREHRALRRVGAPYQVLFEQFGFTPDHVVAAAHASLAQVGAITGSTTGN